MDLMLLWPAGLLALAALAVPLLLHLRRATEARRVDFAALRWLSPRQRPRRRLRLREWLLLLLRLLLVALVALLFAGPARLARGNPPPEILVAPSLRVDAVRATLLGLPGDARWRWLAPGLPSIAQDDLAAPDGARDAPAPLASLLREADARAPAGAILHVVVPAIIDGADGERPRLAHAVRWHVLPAPAPPALPERTAPTLVVQADVEDTAAVANLRAVAQAWTPVAARGSTPVVVGTLADALPPTDRWLVRVDAAAPTPALEAWVRAGGTAMLVPRRATAARPAIDGSAGARAWQREDGTVLATARALGRGRLVVLQRPLDAAALPEVLDAAFPRQLHALMDPRDPASTRAPADALRPVAGGPRFPPVPAPLAPWLCVAAAAVLLLERLLATRAGREAGP